VPAVISEAMNTITNRESAGQTASMAMPADISDTGTMGMVNKLKNAFAMRMGRGSHTPNRPAGQGLRQEHRQRLQVIARRGPLSLFPGEQDARPTAVR
jgi:hypothetical protein